MTLPIVPEPEPTPTPKKDLFHSPVMFLGFALLNLAANFYLVANNQSVPAELWASMFGALTAGGVVTIPGKML